MNTLTAIAFACLAVFASAKPSGIGHGGVLVSGPSGVVTGHGPIGPVGHGWDDGSWDDGSYHGDGGWNDGGHWDGGHSNVVVGNGATLVGPGAGHAVISGPVAHHGGAGVWGHGGAGVWGHGGAGVWGHGGVGVVGLGLGGWGGHGHGHGGVVVQGPHTVPATIVGPSGKVVADGLWGPTHAHGHGHSHW